MEKVLDKYCMEFNLWLNVFFVCLFGSKYFLDLKHFMYQLGLLSYIYIYYYCVALKILCFFPSIPFI